MAGNEVTIAVATALFVAFVLGFVAHWLLSRVGGGSGTRVDASVSEAELQARLARAESELTAALDGLHQARQDSDALRAELGHPAQMVR